MNNFIDNCKLINITSSSEEKISKSIGIVLVEHKDLNYLTLTYLDNNNQLKSLMVKNPESSDFIDAGSFLLYDGKTLYELGHNILIPLDKETPTITIDNETNEILKESALSLYFEIKEYPDKLNR